MDKEALNGLLASGRFEYRQTRDLDLYLFSDEPMAGRILVFDNELPIYNTTIEDVALRKSPTIKEMISIRNAMKILSDGDVVVSKRRDSVLAVRMYCIGDLDLNYTPRDLEELRHDGEAFLDRGYAEGIVETLQLFAEILSFQPPPSPFRLRHHEIFGVLTSAGEGTPQYGPLVMYGHGENRLQYIDRPIRSTDKAGLEWFHQVARGDQEAAATGAEVFDRLRQAGEKQTPRTVPDTPPAWLEAGLSS